LTTLSGEADVDREIKKYRFLELTFN